MSRAANPFSVIYIRMEKKAKRLMPSLRPEEIDMVVRKMIRSRGERRKARVCK